VFKQAWIDEFVNQSKHRSIHDTRRLLSLTLGTGKVKKQTRDEIVFAAHKNFGGGIQRTYHLRCKEGIWGIIRIDYCGDSQVPIHRNVLHAGLGAERPLRRPRVEDHATSSSSAFRTPSSAPIAFARFLIPRP